MFRLRPLNLGGRYLLSTSTRQFHDYFVTHIPSSSLHPDSASSAGPHHKLPRDKSVPHTPGKDGGGTRSPATLGVSRDTTVVRIPLKSAKHHFGVSVSRGSRPYNEDAFQAGTIEIPAFSKRRPVSLTRSSNTKENTSAGGASGDPQVFYFGVFDGHGGTECSQFLREELHLYIEESAESFKLQSSLRGKPLSLNTSEESQNGDEERAGKAPSTSAITAGKKVLEDIHMHDGKGMEAIKPEFDGDSRKPPVSKSLQKDVPDSAASFQQSDGLKKAEELESSLVRAYKKLVGGYFRRFKPEYFSISAGGQGQTINDKSSSNKSSASSSSQPSKSKEGFGIEAVLSYAFLKADYDFIAAQAKKQDEDHVLADRAINETDILDQPSKHSKYTGGPKQFKGGSTCSVALVSTSTPTPFWHPASPSTLITAHVGDTRILLCETATGLAVPLTTNHHPSAPSEADRLRRYAATFVTDSFGEERVSGLANTRAFGDMASKRIGVSAEPEIKRIELDPAQYTFVVLISDGISGTLTDQEIVDIVKEAKTPEQGARDIVSFATEVAAEGDNATALVVRLGGWERRSEGGLGSLGTKELRDYRRQEAQDPRARRQ